MLVHMSSLYEGKRSKVIFKVLSNCIGAMRSDRRSSCERSSHGPYYGQAKFTFSTMEYKYLEEEDLVDADHMIVPEQNDNAMKQETKKAHAAAISPLSMETAPVTTETTTSVVTPFYSIVNIDERMLMVLNRDGNTHTLSD